MADQRRNRSSLLNVNERFIRTRKECPEFGWGDYQVLPSGPRSVLAVRCDWRNNAVLSLHNFSRRGPQVTLEVPGAEKLPLTNLLDANHAPPTTGPPRHRPARLRLPLVPGGPPAGRRHPPTRLTTSQGLFSKQSGSLASLGPD